MVVYYPREKQKRNNNSNFVTNTLDMKKLIILIAVLITTLSLKAQIDGSVLISGHISDIKGADSTYSLGVSSYSRKLGPTFNCLVTYNICITKFNKIDATFSPGGLDTKMTDDLGKTPFAKVSSDDVPFTLDSTDMSSTSNAIITYCQPFAVYGFPWDVAAFNLDPGTATTGDWYVTVKVSTK
jgi:hypothetical protein